MLKSIFFILFFFMLPCLAIAGYPDGFYEVGRIIDGDSFELRDGTRVRLIGIDAPEADEYCFEHSRQRLISLISGNTIYMKKDVSDTDQYQRLLRYVNVGETFVNFTLVDEGYAWAVSYPPDIKYSSQLADAERSARENNRGCLWDWFVWEDSRGYLEIGCFITMQIMHVGSEKHFDITKIQKILPIFYKKFTDIIISISEKFQCESLFMPGILK